MAGLLGNLDAADPYTGSHSRGVVQLALIVAEDLCLDARGRRGVRLGALLHDIGKIWIPEEIVNKPGPLDEDEWVLMRRHTLEGETMLRPLGGLIAAVGRIVRHTHERYDGGGYPDGLAAEEIPIEARIIAVCDAYNAITTDRCYRAARPIPEALVELHRCAGTQFDPEVVEAVERAVLPR